MTTGLLSCAMITVTCHEVSRSVTQCDISWAPVCGAWLLRGWRGHTEQWSRAIPSPSRPPRRGGGCTGQHNAYIPMPYAAHTTASPNTTQYTTHPHTPSVVSPKVRLKTEHLLASSIQRFVLRKWLSDKIQDLYSNSHKYTVPLNECWDYINAGMHIGDWKDMWGQWVNHHVIYKRSHISKRKLWSHWFVDIIFIGLIKTSYQTLLLPTLFAERKRKEK